MKQIIITPENPQGILVDLTSEEMAQREKTAIKEEQLRQKELAEKQAKIDAKASALAKLSALGLTEEEVQAIIK
jgi:phosphopantetheine adenylyltransferase